MQRARDQEPPTEGEKHHVVPRSLGGSNSKTNIVKLTFREHFVAHWLLTKIHTGRDQYKMNYALACMTWKSKGHARIIASWQYEIAKRVRLAAVKAHLKARWEDPKFASMVATARQGYMKEKWQDPAYKAAMSAQRKVQMNSPEQLEMRSVSLKEKWQHPEYRQRMSAQSKEQAKLIDPGHLAMISALAKEQWGNPEFRARTSKAMKAGWTPKHRAEAADRARRNIARLQTPEAHAKRLAALQSPAVKEKRSASIKAAWRQRKMQAQLTDSKGISLTSHP